MTGRKTPVPYPTSLDALSDFDRRIIALCREGKDYTAIASKLGAHPRTISGRARIINSLVQPGQPPVLDSSHYGRVRISRHADAINHLDQQIIALYSQGLTHQEIGDRLGGMPRQTVATRIARLRDTLGETILKRRYADPNGEHRNTASQSEPTDRAGRVRCLGGCDHYFDSPDRCRIRICATCKAKHRESGEIHTGYRLLTA